MIFFYFYIGIIEDFEIDVPFTIFESNILKVFNIALSQLHLNSWTFTQCQDFLFTFNKQKKYLGMGGYL